MTTIDVVSLPFEVKADIYSFLIAGVNPSSKLIALVNDCSRTILPTRISLPVQKRKETFTREDYLNSFYNILQSEPCIQQLLVSAEDLMQSKDVNHQVMLALAEKFSLDKAKQAEIILQKLKSPLNSAKPALKKEIPAENVDKIEKEVKKEPKPS